jgi:hypothetical protein
MKMFFLRTMPLKNHKYQIISTYLRLIPLLIFSFFVSSFIVGEKIRTKLAIDQRIPDRKKINHINKQCIKSHKKIMDKLTKTVRR